MIKEFANFEEEYKINEGDFSILKINPFFPI